MKHETTNRSETMNPTAADYEKLARTYLLAADRDPDTMETILGGKEIPAWEYEGIDEDNELVSTTHDTLDDFRRNSGDWRECSPLIEQDGGLYWESCQATKGQQRTELCVIDCGEFRLCYQV